MPDAALSTLQTLFYLIFATAPRGMTFLQVRKLRCRKAKKLAADHGAGVWQRHGANPCLAACSSF